MKKLLLGTTALVGASFAATAAFAAPEVRLGGYMDFQTGITNQDVTGYSPAPGVPGVSGGERGFGFVTDTELLIRASDKLDNGLRWAVKIEMEADSQDRSTATDTLNNNADEVTMTFTGTWGQLTLGNEDGPSDSMKMTDDGMVSGIGASSSKGWRRWVNTKSFANSMWTAPTDITDTNDATKVMYFTPTIAGFQFGVSYTADDADSGRIRASDSSIAGVGQQNYENWVEAGLTYEFKIDEIEFGVAATGNTANSKSTSGRTGQDDIQSWALSGKAEIGAFTVSGGYGTENAAGAIHGTETSGYGGGVKYKTGPYQIGVSFMHNDQSNPITVSGGRDYSDDVYTLGASYALGAGIATYVDTWYFTNDAGGTPGLLTTDSIGVLLGTQITF